MFKRSVVLAAVAAISFSSSAQAVTFNATASTLKSVFATTNSGDTIVLSGNFGQTTLQNRSFSSGLTINASAASFSDTLVLRNLSNVNVIGGHYGSGTQMTSYNRGVWLDGGSNISFVNPSVVGYYIGMGNRVQRDHQCLSDWRHIFPVAGRHHARRR